ncbi:DNA repair protein RAD5 [Striga asiatica]|uniref:DNA repair protein RAD5 n=1 Tax=Striga asiatica TaxID=4170 RepID=A0A5A7NZP1_STRAF|nr:DNA repair protein RAD5 [Striga asiatica]
MSAVESESQDRHDPVEVFMSLESWPSSPAADEPPTDTLLVGFVIANVVGLRYYEGRISGREMVGLVRDDLNPHDANAIKVLNMRSVQVLSQNHLEKEVDSSFPVKSTFLRGQTNLREIGGLQLISESNASFTLSESVAVKEKKGSVAEKSVDEIFKLLDLKVSKETSEALEPPKDMIKSELFPHQKEGLGWLVSRENSKELPPFWEEKNGIYVNELTNYQTDIRPEPLRGGIFADDMGLGKTLTLLSLLALDKARAANSSGYMDVDDNEEEHSAFLSKASKRGRGSKKAVNLAKKRKIGDFNANEKGKGPAIEKSSSSSDPMTTLIVCPPSVFSAWITQLEEHTRKGVFKVYIYYGERTKDTKELQKHDIVLTTYSTLASEAYCGNCPIKKIEWRRVILDEAHVIKNVSSQQSRAVTNLNAKCRWAVTGTPVQNNSFDLFSLVAFLKFEPLSVKGLWNSLIQRPLAQGDEKGVSRLQVLMAAISLRRTKDKGLIGLPAKSIETVYVNLSEKERRIYDQMEEEARNFVKAYISDENMVRNYSTVLSILVRLRQVCTDMALCPEDLRTLTLPSQIEDVKNNPTLLQKLLSVLQDGEDFDCPICISPPTDTIITCCAHIFCGPCIVKTLKRTKPNCPMCRNPLSESDLFKAPQDPTQAQPTEKSSSTLSSKAAALLKLLKASRDAKDDPPYKSVVFSQFRKLLILLEGPLREAGFDVVRLDGSMNAKKRAQVIREFSGPDGPTVLLASLKASNAGINLAAASRVYLVEPWWNPAVEEQAMDRVHRIGQKEDVKIVRLIARDTIEERILRLQESKRALARRAFGGKGQKGQREISRDELGVLMNL